MQPRPITRCLAALFAGLVLAAVSLRADSLDDGFRNPPDSAKPQTWWHWMNGEVTKEGITLDLEAMKRVGIGGAQIFNVDCGTPAGPAKFLGPEWRELMQHAVREADRLGLELTIHNGAGWSSSGGPWNTPEHAMQRVTFSEQTVKGPTRFNGVLPQAPTQLKFYRDIAVLAFRAPAEPGPVIDDLDAKAGFNGHFVDFPPPSTNNAVTQAVQKSDILDLTTKLSPDGRLEWDVPDGDWIILRVGYTPTGAENHPAPAGGVGLECDKFSQEALDAHWAGFVQKVLDDAGPLAGKGRALDNILIDSYEVGGQNWTPQFRAEFSKRRGYDPALYLPVLAGRVVDSPEISERFLWDMRRTIADLFADNYYGHFQELCHAHGLKASFEPYTGPFDSMQCGARADIPMGEFWVGNNPDPSVKLASSIGHTYGQPVIGAESFTGAPARQHGRWLDDPCSLKTLGDQVFCEGINRFIFHRYAMQPWTNRWPGMTMGPWGTHFDRTETWWEQGRAWMQYLARCQYLLQQGKPVADAAYFNGENAPVELRGGVPALPPGHDWDSLDADVLLHHSKVEFGSLVLDSGASYRMLILPPSDRQMRPEVLRRISQLLSDGLTLVGAPPEISPSLENYPACDADVKSLAAELWGDCDGTRVRQHQWRGGKVIWGMPMALVFEQLELPPDFECVSNYSAKLSFIHRHDADADAEIYFVSNQRRQLETVECAFRTTDRSPELWNPETGVTMPAPVWRAEAGRTVVSLSLDPAGSVFVVFRGKPQTDHLVSAHFGAAVETQAVVKPPELRIIKAAYGSFAKNQVDITSILKPLIARGRRDFRADNDLADGDPSPGVVKRLRVEYDLDGAHKTVVVTEGDVLYWPNGAKLVQAIYGDVPAVGNPTWIDLTKTISALVAAGKAHINVNNDLAGTDPAPNVGKSLVVEFSVNGSAKKVEVTEGGVFDAPRGAVITSAKYGSSEGRMSDEGPTVDVTAKLAVLVNNGTLSVVADNALAGGDPDLYVAKELQVDYTVDGVLKHIAVDEDETLTLPEDASPAGRARDFDFAAGPDGRDRLLAWSAGKLDLTWASGRETNFDCAVAPAPVPVSGSWQISFPPGWGAPASVTANHLQSWTDFTDPGVKYFSGTAEYAKDIEIPGAMLDSGREVWLDLGTVKDFAEVSVNGQPLGILWKPPFRVNITSAAHPGANSVRIKVTNLWPNRLIGDEQLPDDRDWSGGALKSWPKWLLEDKPSPTGRVTFTTWHHWKKDDALLDSGLLGPVTLRTAEEVELP